MTKQTKLPFMEDIERAEQQIAEEQRAVDYDTKEYVVGVLVSMLEKDDIVIPEYQRKFIWDEVRQSRFIESMILGLPIPYLFFFERDDGRFEVVDGSQRIRTVKRFVDNALELIGLEKLTALIGYSFEDLPTSQKRKFLNRSLRIISLSERSDKNVRFDLFERINSGSVSINPSEFRQGAFAGEFYNLVIKCSKKSLFRRLCPVSRKLEDRGEREELVLRFFAYADRYREFVHDVSNFLNDYIRDMNSDGDLKAKENQFEAMLEFVDKYFPYGFRKTKSAVSTPRVRFEAISVGTHLALEIKPDLIPNDMKWLTSEEFADETTTHASNSAPRLKSRIEFVRDALLGRHQ